MIICAALRIKDTDTVIGCCRHGDGYSTLHDLKPEIGISQVEEGFLTNHGEFLDRTQAFENAWEQMSWTTRQYKQDKREFELYSEDLY